MKPSTFQPGRELVRRLSRVLAADALLLPTGFVTTVFLTRELGPERFGLFALAVAVISWLELSTTSLFSRATIRSVGAAEDWRPIGATATRLQLTVGCGVALLLWVLAGPIARQLDEPELSSLLRLFAIEIPLFSLARAHQNVLTGLGNFNERALATGGRWIARLTLIVLLVTMGYSVTGAILGSIGAIFVEFVIARTFIQPSLIRRSSFPAKRLWAVAAPILLFSLSMRLYGKLDLFAFKLLGATTAEAGIYAAAQSVVLVPSLFVLSFSPLLLSTLSRTLRTGDSNLARVLSRNALRGTVVLFPFAGMTAGAAPQIILVVFSPRYQAADAVLAWLIFGVLALAMISIATSILIAAGEVRWTLAIAGPMLPVAGAGTSCLFRGSGPTALLSSRRLLPELAHRWRCGQSTGPGRSCRPPGR